MPFSQEKTDELKSAIKLALASNKLNSWERQFLSDMQSRINRFGTATKLSSKQYAKLHQMLKPFRQEVTPQRSAPVRKPSPVRKSVTSNNVVRKPSYTPGRPTRRRTYRSLKRDFWSATYIVGIILAATAFFASLLNDSSREPASSSYDGSALTSSGFSVIDGDTIKLNGHSNGTRLVGFNTPETYKPECNRELELGQAATRRLKTLVRDAGAVRLELVECACKPGTQGTRNCNYGRTCGKLSVDGRDVGDILISEGLAVAFRCGWTSCPPTPRPWCGG